MKNYTPVLLHFAILCKFSNKNTSKITTNYGNIPGLLHYFDISVSESGSEYYNKPKLTVTQTLTQKTFHVRSVKLVYFGKLVIKQASADISNFIELKENSLLPEIVRYF